MKIKGILFVFSMLFLTVNLYAEINLPNSPKGYLECVLVSLKNGDKTLHVNKTLTDKDTFKESEWFTNFSFGTLKTNIYIKEDMHSIFYRKEGVLVIEDEAFVEAYSISTEPYDDLEFFSASGIIWIN